MDSSESAPSAPPIPPNVKYDGYEGIGFDANVVIPAATYLPTIDPSAPRGTFKNTPVLTEDEAKEALATFVSSKCCYGKNPIKNMIFTNLESSSTYRYILRTFTETRVTSWASEPYNGQVVSNNGPPPMPWDIPVTPTTYFKSQVVNIEVPNTAYVKACDTCNGARTKLCFRCHGRGKRTCHRCHGSGRIAHHQPGATGGAQPSYGSFNPGYDNDNHHHHHHGHHRHGSHGSGHAVPSGGGHAVPSGGTHFDPCFHCGSSGFENCGDCFGSGRINCATCNGQGNLKWFIRLSVKFDNNENDFLKKSECIPDDLLRNCAALSVFTETYPRVNYIDHHQCAEINRASYDLINSHSTRFKNCRILSQQHEVNEIPITDCHYRYKDMPQSYFVYGLDRQVYAPNYPQKCCCNIL